MQLWKCDSETAQGTRQFILAAAWRSEWVSDLRTKRTKGTFVCWCCRVITSHPFGFHDGQTCRQPREGNGKSGFEKVELIQEDSWVQLRTNSTCSNSRWLEWIGIFTDITRKLCRAPQQSCRSRGHFISCRSHSGTKCWQILPPYVHDWVLDFD